MNTSTPLVSIVTPVYQSEDVLARALGSLLGQEMRDWEMLIVDDGSREPSWRVVQSYSWIDPRIRVMRQKHGGACAARNTGIAEARGKYISFLDADDWLEPDALAAMVSACEKEDCAAVHGGFRYATPDGQPTTWHGGYSGEAPLFTALGGSNVLSVPSVVLVRRSVLDDIGLFDTSLVHCGDWDLWGRLARNDGHLGHVPQPVTGYRMRPGSLSRNPQSLLRDATTSIRRLHSADSRVLHPQPRFANGIERDHLPSRIAHFGVYAAGLAVSGGDYSSVTVVLDSIPDWTPLSPVHAGEFIFYALCFANCCEPAGISNFWPRVVQPVKQLLLDLEARTETPGLSERIWEMMDGCSEERLANLPLPLPEPVGMPGNGRTHRPAAYDTLAYDTLRTLAGPL